MFAPLQVLRGSRLRQSAPGTSWSAAERDANERDTIQMLRRDSAGDSAAKKAKIAADTEHLASFDFLSACVDVLRLMTNESIDAWWKEGALPLDEVPRSLSFCMGWEQKQWRVLWLLRNYIGININGVYRYPPSAEK